MNAPRSICEWCQISTEFTEQYNFSHCIGAIDGKHVNIQALPRSGSTYFSYEKAFSMVLLAICYAKYEFSLVEIRKAGRQSDGGMRLYQPETISGFNENKKFPYTFVADEAFPSKPHMM